MCEAQSATFYSEMLRDPATYAIRAWNNRYDKKEKQMTHAAQHQAAAAAPPASIHPEGMYRWNQFSALIPFSRETWRRAYNHAEYLDERRQLMQWWSDYLDRCAVKAEK